MKSNTIPATTPSEVRSPKPVLSVIQGGARKTGKTRRMQQFVKSRPSAFLRIEFDIHRADAPALRSAIDEISNEVGGRLEGPHSFATEQALTNAARALGCFRAAVNALVNAGDPDYKARTAKRAV